MTSRLRRLLLAMLLALQGAGAWAATCAGPTLRFEPIGPGVWLVPAALGDADADNDGFVSNLVLAHAGRRWWLLGSGPSTGFAQRLACHVRQRFGARVTDVISPWARPELVLGLGGFPGARLWAHRGVASAMRSQCAQCSARLRQRLGLSADDPGAAPIVLPDRELRGAQGRLGPFDWWLLPRGPARYVTVWRHAAGAARCHPAQACADQAPAGPVVWVAHGLLAATPPGDGREADLDVLTLALQRLQGLARPDGVRARWVGEQGDLQDAGAPSLQARYWQDLRHGVQAAIDAGADEAAPAAALAGWPAALAQHPWHALNWQRAWRQLDAHQFADRPR